MAGKNSQRGQGTERHRPREKPSEGHQTRIEDPPGDWSKAKSLRTQESTKVSAPPLWNQLSLQNQTNRVRQRLRTQVRRNERGNTKERTEEPPKNGFE